MIIKQIYLLAFALLFILPVVSAAECNLGTYKYEDEVQLLQTCASCTYNNLTFLKYPSGQIEYFNTQMTKDSSSYSFTLNSSYTNQTGKYIYNGIGDPDAVIKNWNCNFYVNAQGQEYSAIEGIVYLSLFLVLIGMFIAFLYFGLTIEGENIRNEDKEIVMINYKKYFKYSFFVFAYLVFVGLMFFGWNIASGILNFSSLGNFFYVFYNISFVGMFLYIPIMFYVIIRKLIEDSKILKELQKEYESAYG